MNDTRDLFGPPPASAPRYSKAWTWSPITPSTWEVADPRAPRDVYRITLCQMTTTRQGLACAWYHLTGPDLSLQSTNLALLRRKAREHANRREGGRKAAATRAAYKAAE